MAGWARRKTIDTVTRHEAGRTLKATLSWPQLIALGVGSVIGTGIYTLTGVGAGIAGPGVILAFGIAGLVCVFAGLAYAELATLLPAAGSAYTYVYTALGEALAWIIGWSMALEYLLGASAVSVGWSAHLVEWLHSIIAVPPWMMAGPFEGGVVNLPAVLVALGIAVMLTFGVSESATVNIFLVVIKLVALTAFVVLTAPMIKAENYHPFMPYGFFPRPIDGQPHGVMTAAALVFFAFYGFDAVSTAAEEAKRPGRDLTIGLLGSLAICAVIYMAVSASAVGALPFGQFAKSAAPLVKVLQVLHQPLGAYWIAFAALIALPSVILVDMYAQSRIFFVMSRDGLLPHGLSKVHPKFGTPVVMTLLTGVFVAIVGGLAPLKYIAEVANAGTLAAFTAVAVAMMVLRITRPDIPRVFNCPLWWLVGPLAIIGCLWLFCSLPPSTMLMFLGWNGLGLLVYFAFGYRHSRIGKGLGADGAAQAPPA